MTISVTTTSTVITAPDTRLTLAEIIDNVCKEVGLETPATLVGSTDQTARELLHHAVEASEEIARRVDWGELRFTETITGDGVSYQFALPDSFSRLTRGTAVTFSGVPVRGGLSEDEWADLTPAEGTPRFFRLRGKIIELYPYPASGVEGTVSYQSENWSSAGLNYWAADDDKTIIPHQLLQKGIVWRWRRQKGEDYSDYLAEFEAAMQDYSAFDDRARTP